LIHDELLDPGRPGAVLDGGGANARALLEVLVWPDVNDLVERAELGMPERRERRVFLAVFIGFGKALFDFRHEFRLDVGGPHLVNHGYPLSENA
jgi:hypothetical protein